MNGSCGSRRQEFFKQLSMKLDLNKRVERLTYHGTDHVEIAKAYLMGSKLLVVLYPETGGTGGS